MAWRTACCRAEGLRRGAGAGVRGALERLRERPAAGAGVPKGCAHRRVQAWGFGEAGLGPRRGLDGGRDWDGASTGCCQIGCGEEGA
jgi:hypothetical protein